jgi:O-antigen/teichoic acid export membrane protein
LSEACSTSLRVSERCEPVASLRWNFSWTLVGNVIYAGCRWGMLVVLAKLSSSFLVGEYALGLAIAAPILMFTNLNLRSVQTTDVREGTPFSHYLGFRIATTIGGLIIIQIILTFMKVPWSAKGLLFMVAVSQAVESVSDVYYGRMQFRDRMDRIAKSMIARAPLSMLAFTLILVATKSLFWSVTGVVVARLMILLLYDARRSVHGLDVPPFAERPSDLLRPRWDGLSYFSLAKFCAPLGVISLLNSFNGQVPRYFIQGSLGTSDVGIFSAMAFLTSSGSLIVQSLGQSAFVQMAKDYAEGRLEDFKRLLGKLLMLVSLVGGAGVLVAALMGRQLLTLLYRPEYAEHVSLFVLIVAAGAIDYLSSVIGFAATSARAFYPQIPLLSTVSIASVLSSFFFIRLYGLSGAGIATVCTSLTFFLGEILLLIYLLHARRRVNEPLTASYTVPE